MSGTAAPDPRIAAIKYMAGRDSILANIDAADRAAGVIRVRVDAATEAVHIAICEDRIEDCLAYRGRCVKAVEALAHP